MLAAAAPRPMSWFPSPVPRRGDVSAGAASSLGDAEGAGWEVGVSKGPPRLYHLEKELGLVTPSCVGWLCHPCSFPKLSFEVKLKNINNFGPFPLSQCPHSCVWVLAIAYPWRVSWCWHLPISLGTSSPLLTFGFAAL